MKTKKVLALVLAILMSIGLLAACGGNATTTDDGNGSNQTSPNASNTGNGGQSGTKGESTPSQAESKTLRVLLEAEPETLDPTNGSTAASNVMAPFITAMYIPLLNSDESGNIEPGLIKSWEWIDAQHLRVTLQDVVTHGGNKLTCEDVIYSFRNGQSGSAASFFTMLDLDKFEIIDETTMVMATNIPYPSLLEAFLNPTYNVYSQKDVESLSDRNNPADACYGRYIFKEWIPGQSITLVRNENYFDPTDAGIYEEIVCTFNSDASARALALQSGDADVAINLSVSQTPTLESAGFTTNLRDTTDVMSVYLNCSRKPFDDERVRQAIGLLLNRAAVREVLYSGYGSIVAAPFSSATPYYQPYDDAVNVETAKNLLAEAGYADGFSFTLAGLQNTSLAAEVIQANLSAANINVNISLIDFGGYIATRRSGDYDAFLGIGGGMDFANVLKGYDGRFDVTEAFGGAQYHDDTHSYDLIDAVYAELDLEPRVRAMNALCDYMVDKGVMISLCSVARIDPVSADVDGLTWHSAVFVDVSRMYAK